MDRGRTPLWRRAFVLAVMIASVVVLVPSAVGDTPTWDTTPSDIGPLEGDTTGGKVVTYTDPTASSAEPPATVGCLPGSGSLFSVGTTGVTCTATDANSDTATIGFNVTVVDTTPPTAPSQSNITTEATGPSGTPVSFSPTSTDIVDPNPVVNCTPSSGTFGITTTTVNCTATDASSNTSSTGSFTVTVQDTTKPALSLPSPITAEATSAGGATVSYAATASDAVDGSPSVSCSPPSGSNFPMGTTTVNCSSTDSHSNIATGSFTVTVRDTKPPVLSGVPSDSTLEATGPGGAVARWAPTATDNIDPAPSITCSPQSGSLFPLGKTTVTCIASDSSGNKDVQTFAITVVDTKPPTFASAKDVTVEATGPSGAAFTYNTGASDLVDGDVPSVCTPASGSTFPLGTTSVTCTATDKHGNKSQASFAVTVRDTTPPRLTGVPSSVVERVDGKKTVEIDYDQPSATDVVDGSVGVNCDPPSGSEFKLGTTKVVCRAQDSRGNKASASFLVRVSDTVAPPRVSKVLAKVTKRGIAISWPALESSDVAGFQVWRLPGVKKRTRALSAAVAANPPGSLVYRGRQTTFVDVSAKQGVRYRYSVFSYDWAGNRSPAAVVRASLTTGPLLSPLNGASIKTPPVLVWKPVPKASYYNVQLFRGTAKVLSIWPRTHSLKLQSSWEFRGKRYTLLPGLYRWYVFPGFGPLADARYGALLGQSTFVVTK